MRRHRPIRILALAAILSGVVTAQQAQQQKPTLESVDKTVKQAAAQQATAATQAKTDGAQQSAAMNKVLLQQAQSEITALKVSADAKDNAALAQYKQDQRMLAIELALTQAKRQKEQDAAEAKRSRDDLMNRAGELTIGLLLTLVAWVAKELYGLFLDGRRHRAEQQGRELAAEAAKSQAAKLDQIHTLVNGSVTVALENELDARRANLVSLQEILHLRIASGGPPNPEAVHVIEAQRTKIAVLETQLNERLASTHSANAQLDRTQKDS